MPRLPGVNSMKRVLLALVLCAPMTAAVAQASGKDPLTQGDAAAGATKAAACAACHGVGGDSAMPDWPKLAAQGGPYIATQLKLFKSGERKNPIMQAQAVPLSEQDMKDIGAYYAQQKAAPGLASKDAVAIAEPIYRGGVATRGIPACASCHGPNGAGNPAAGYPRLSGQHAKYAAAQLQAYRSGERAAGGNGQMMAAIAAKLSDQEIEALASYLNGLQ